MTRLEILVSLSGQLKGSARLARVDMDDINSSMVLYIREYIRHRLRSSAPDFEKILQQWWNDEVHQQGNMLLRAMGKDKKEGGETLKSQVADLVMAERIIEKSLLKQYKSYFKGSWLRKFDWISYNHYILLRAVGEAFLYSLDPANMVQVPTISMNLSTGQVLEESMTDLDPPLLAWYYMDKKLEEAGMHQDSGIWRNREQVEFFHYSIIPNTSYPIGEPRCGLMPYLYSYRF